MEPAGTGLWVGRGGSPGAAVTGVLVGGPLVLEPPDPRGGETARWGWLTPPDRNEWIRSALGAMKVPPGGSLPKGWMERLDETVSRVEEAARPSLLFQSAPIEEVAATAIQARGFSIESTRWARVAAHLKTPGHACALALTLGAGMDEIATALEKGSLSRAFRWDALASSLVELLVEQAEAFLAVRVAERGEVVTSRFSPGYCDWPLTSGQEALFSFCRPEQIGLRLTASGLMAPRKSVTAVILTAREAPLRAPCSGCRRDCSHHIADPEEIPVSPPSE